MKTTGKDYYREYRKNNKDKISRANKRYKEKQKAKQQGSTLQEIKTKQETMEAAEAPAEEQITAQAQPQEQPKEQIKEQAPAEKEVSQDKTTSDFFASLKKDYREAEKPQDEKPAEKAPEEKPIADEIKPNKSIPSAETQTLITGYLFLLAVNSVYPDILLWFLSFMSPKYRAIKSDNISMDADEFAMIEPIADEVVKIYLPKINPLALLFICLNASYYQKIKEEMKRNPPRLKVKKVNPRKPNK